MAAHSPDRPIASVLTFLAIAYGGAWLIALPLWLGDGLASPWFPLVGVAMMFTPSIAAVVTLLVVQRRRDILRAVGLWPIARPARFALYMVLGLVLPVALVLAALVTGAVLGQYPADFAGAGSLYSTLAASGFDATGVSVTLLVTMQFVNVLVGALINTVPALGEEVGWRGWLLPQLLRLGTVPAIVLSGIAWGVWHAPLLLLGYNYPGAPGWLGVLMMTGMCILVGAVFGWLRVRSESVLPAALAHGSFNAAVGLSWVFAQAGAHIDTVDATILGWSGWLVPAVLVVVLVLTGRFATPSGDPLPRRPAPTQAPHRV